MGQRTQGGRTEGDVGKIGQAKRMRLTRPGNHPTEGASRTPPPTVGAIHTLRHKTRRVRLPHASKWCAGCAREIAYAGLWTRDGRTGGDADAIGQAEWMRLTQPGNPANAGRRGRRPLRWVRNEGCGIRRGGCDCPTPPNGARAVPAGLHTWGSGRKAGAPRVTRSKSVRPNVCV